MDRDAESKEGESEDREPADRRNASRFIDDPQVLLAMPAVTDFVAAARAYCAWADAAPGDARFEVRSAQHLLARLHACGLALPEDVDVGDADADSLFDTRYTQLHKRFGSLPIQYYRIELQPFVSRDGETGCGDLCDDLADVYLDLAPGLALFDAGHVVAAVWEWSFTFSSHWARHALEALWIMEQWSRGGDDDDKPREVSCDA